jgi:hypothetical protein
MVDRLRTLMARFITRWLQGPPTLLIRAWAWLCSETDDLSEKRRCLERILEIDSTTKWVHQTLAWVQSCEQSDCGGGRTSNQCKMQRWMDS